MRKLGQHRQEGAILSVYAFVAVAFLSLIILFMSERVNKTIRVSGQSYAEKQSYWNAQSGLKIATGLDQTFETDFDESKNWNKGEISVISKRPEKDPIAKYNFDGNLDDSSGDHDLTLEGGSEIYDTDRYCVSDRSIDLTAGGKYLTEDEMSLALSGSDHTISAWVKTNISQGVLIAFNTSIFGTRLVYFNNGKFCFYDESRTNNCSPTYIDDNEWHHIAAVYNNGSNTISTYIDGVEQRTDIPVNVNITDTDLFLIGQEWLSDGIMGSYFIGNLDDLYIFDYALTIQEIDNLASFYPDRSTGRLSGTVRTKKN
jgi:hypothetical protein